LETHVTIPTEPIGSVPRPDYLIEAMTGHASGTVTAAELDNAFERATRETIAAFEQTGSPIIADGEQTKPSFATYPLSGLTNLAPDGVVIPFADGHTRQLPRLTAGPFRYGAFTRQYVESARSLTNQPVKQAVISCSAISLLYPQDGIEGYSQEEFLDDLVEQAEADIRGALDAGAQIVQVDFTEARLSLKLDPSQGLLRQFVDLNNRVLDHFSPEEQMRLGVHTCPGGDQDSTHSADVPYSELLPLLFELHVGNFYLEYAAEPNKEELLRVIAENVRPGQRVFLGVTDVLDPRVETAEEVRDMILQAARVIPVEQLGTTDDCGFSPFGDDTSTSREIAFAKIKARVEGTRLAEQALASSA
jgi:5-methyltetrahydropteroyltriglutamate--homocysteine methyltransferase